MTDDNRRPPASALRASLAADTPRRAVAYDGAIGPLVRIALVNTLLAIVTLGFYRFWGKTRLRRYFWSHVAFEGEPLEYTGRAMELFLGFLIVIAILVPLFLVLGIFDYLLTGEPRLRAGLGIVQFVVIVFLVNLAIFRARRYRLTRTQWRGIRGGQTGSAVRYGLTALGWLIVVMLSLGLAYPVMRTRLQRYRTENTWFGSIGLSFDGLARALFARWLMAWLLFVPTLGLSWVWYRAAEFRYFVAQTRCGGLRFASTLSAPRVIGIGLRFILAMLALAVAMMGLAYVLSILFAGLTGFSSMGALAADSQEPVVAFSLWHWLIVFGVLLFFVPAGIMRVAFLAHPLIRAVCDSLSVSGREDYDAIRQSEQARPKLGEGLADALDVGSI